MPEPTPAPNPVREGVNKFFTMGTVGTFAGSVAALTLIVNVMYDVLGVGSKPVTLGIALALSIGTCLWSTSAKGRKLIGAVAIAFINGLLIYGTAYGVDMSMITNEGQGDSAGPPPIERPAPDEPGPLEPEDPRPAPPPKEVDRPRIDTRQEGPFGTRKVPMERLKFDPKVLEGG